MALKCRLLKNSYCEITQFFGGVNNHIGIDIVGKNFTIDTVLAHSAGTVVMVQTNQKNNQGSTGYASYGNFVKIDHGDGLFTLYAHLDTVNVKLGDVVTKGSVIGNMGNTGNSYGAHLHFEVLNDNTRIDPYPYLDNDLKESMPQTVIRDTNKNQLKVNVSDLRIRTSPKTDSKIIGFALENGIYNYTETKNNEDYVWYKIDTDRWVANRDNWLTIYEKESINSEEENQILKDKLNLLENSEQIKLFIAPRSGLYYIDLNKDEHFTYIRTKKNY